MTPLREIGLRNLRGGYLPIGGKGRLFAAYIMVLLKFALARSIELQFVDGATKTTGLAVLRPFCTKTQSAASPRLGLAYVLFDGKLVTGARWHRHGAI